MRLKTISAFSPDGESLKTGAGPNLPPEYNAAIDGSLIGPAAGSCGTAVYRKALVVVEDIATDPLWAGYADLALRHGLRACWSTPLIAKNGRVLGAFATYSRKVNRPTPYDLGVIDRLAASAARCSSLSSWA